MIKVRLQQTSLIILGLATAVIMIFLGLWQLQVFQNQGQDGARARMGEPPVPLTSVAEAGTTITDGYGRTVTFSGEYAVEDQVLVADPDIDGRYRVLTPMILEDGSYLPVVRGEISDQALADAGGDIPPPPAAVVEDEGVLLASEKSSEADLPEDQIGSVHLPVLIQGWDRNSIAGFVTLGAESSQAQNLQPSDPELPSGRGSAQNAGYALQWWVFAAVALGFSIYMAVKVGRAAERRRLAERGLISEDEVGPDASQIS